VSEGVGKTPLSELKDMFSKQGISPNNEPVQMEGSDHPPTRQYRPHPSVAFSGMYEDESDWLYCSIFLRLWFF
jgi:hypothetical protein